MLPRLPFFFLALACGLQGQEVGGFFEAPPPKGDWSLRLGAMVLTAPKYPGSDEMRVLPLPVFAAEYRQRVFLGSSRVAVGVGAGIHLWRAAGFTWDLGLGIGERRPESKADALAGMGDRQASLFAGTGLSWRSRGFSAGITLAAGLRDEAGFRGTLNLGYGQRLGGQWFGNIGLSATAGDTKNMGYDFGVSPEQAARRAALLGAGDPRLKPGEAGPFFPKGGFREASASAGLSYLVDARWRIFSFLSATELQGDARKSPLVRRTGNMAGAAGFAYQF